MNVKLYLRRKKPEDLTGENQKGQSIVLITLALVAIIGFLGIALDVGFIFARGSQLQAGMDSAALAGVSELSEWSPGNAAGNFAAEGNARTKSGQFLNANGMPLSVTLSLNETENLHVEQTPIGEIQYSITATWPVETFFLKVLGFDGPIELTRSATGAIFSLADIYASRRIEDGIISTSNQAVFGPFICTAFGDPYSPWNSSFWPNEYTYSYRIMIPAAYREEHSEVRVELMDPDSINNDGAGPFTIPRTQAAIDNGLSATTTGSCQGSQVDRRNACLIPTGELALVPGVPLDRINPYFFWRIDENRGAGAAPGNGNCGSPGSYNTTYNTRTLYELYYFRENPDGTVVREELARYTGQTASNSDCGPGSPPGCTPGDHLTDMYWVSPGAPASFDQPPTSYNPYVPKDGGSTTANGFQIHINNDLPNIVIDQGNDAVYIGLDVTTIDGASENGFEVWAGPPDYINSVPSEANARNLHVLNSPGSHTSDGATVFASGTLPMNSNVSNQVDIPLMYVSPDFAGENIFVSLFDTDSGASPPITFFFDTIAEEDWSLTFADAPNPDPDGQVRNCVPGSCNNQWVTPPYLITVPGILDECDYSDPDENCVPFYGGRLTARYNGGTGDTYVWQITVNGLPYLVR